jgi:hypothetical protein
LRIAVTLTSIPVKTPDGLAELRQRTRRLSQRHRTVLLLVDGKRSLIEVQTMALQAGAPQSCVDDLLTLGLIVITQPTVPVTRYSAALTVDSQQPDIWLHSDLPETAGPSDSVVSSAPASASASASAEPDLPETRTLAPDSVNGDSASGHPEPLPSSPPSMSQLQRLDDGEPDEALEEARDILARAVRREAPLAGSLTLLRLRRARTRDELHALLEEVEIRISRPQRALAAQQTLRRVRQLLSGEPEPEPPRF